MANSTNILTNNTTTPLAKSFLKAFECERVLTKAVDTQLLSGVFSPKSGSTADFRRPMDAHTTRTSGGDISSSDKSDIVVGKATGTVQEYFTVAVDWDEVDEALKLDQLDQLVMMPAAQRLITDLEVDFGKYMLKNCGLYYGDPNKVVDAWSDVAGADALMTSMGVPSQGERCYVMNPYTTTNLANVQNALANGDDSLVNTAWQNAQVSRKFGNMMALQSSALGSYSTSALADFAGALTATPSPTYNSWKDTMTMDLAVGSFASGTDEIVAGTIVEIPTRLRVSGSTRQPFLDATGAQVAWSGVVTETVALVGGAGTINVAGAAIYEATGDYNTVSSALTSGDVINIVNDGAASTTYQPNLFFHKQAFGIGTVPLKKLYSTDTIATTKDGMQIRVCKYADGDSNKQKVRFDILPAYATFNPLYAGQGFGV